MERDPGYIMNQIRQSVRNSSVAPIREDIIEVSSVPVNSSELFRKTKTNLQKVRQRITTNLPVAFLPGRLVSRYRLGQLIVPWRKIGARLFTKWYVDAYTQQQKHLNHDLWYGLNALIEQSENQLALINDLLYFQEEQKKQINTNNEEIAWLKERHKESLQILNEQAKFISSHSGFTDKFKYSEFAKRFSASEEAIKENYSPYLPVFSGCKRVLDIGCGRGYFLDLLQSKDIHGVGIDSDPELIAICKKNGHEAYVDDGNHFLSQLDNGNLDGIFAGHIIEHLNLSAKIGFLEQCYDKLNDNGVLLLETPNTTSVYVMHNLYYLDPTHEKPLFPEALKHLAEIVGFEIINSYLSGTIDASNQKNDYYNYTLILKKVVGGNS